MTVSFLFGRGYGAFPLQFIDPLDELGKEFDQPGAGAPESPIALGQLLPDEALAWGHDSQALTALLRDRQHPALMQVARLTPADRLAAFAP